jgi:hypothetical protein
MKLRLTAKTLEDLERLHKLMVEKNPVAGDRIQPD